VAADGEQRQVGAGVEQQRCGREAARVTRVDKRRDAVVGLHVDGRAA
jgi:hypothetical protein